MPVQTEEQHATRALSKTDASKTTQECVIPFDTSPYLVKDNTFFCYNYLYFFFLTTDSVIH
uniref:Uncharacterized protein n=1 Tax=Anguilla anguilla TaxID=7936 RepID=A0A0E9TVY0_ANGAN